LHSIVMAALKVFIALWLFFLGLILASNITSERALLYGVATLLSAPACLDLYCRHSPGESQKQEPAHRLSARTRRTIGV
jgi:hypothetical protein